ncbi:hypothetical protein H0H87_007859 [Tephrocybe sp. NHM501043]|nr:hypothetical protein H0H87_007859 [Tephrocybe sp. NHM501043]
MDGGQTPKKEERESPSLELTGNAHEPTSFPLPPPSSSTFDQLKEEESKEEPLSPSYTSMELKLEPKTEDEPSPLQSPTLHDEFSPQKSKLSPSPTPPPSTTNGTASMSSTPPPSETPVTMSKKSQTPPVQLIGDLPIARDAALATFTEIETNNYQYKTLGRSREALESMTCDCIFDPEHDDPDLACGHDSDCINRLTQVECLPEDCRCGGHCRNQRFQNREYADIDIVKTELKGFGLRAEKFLPKDTFIYEYVGDVVNPVSFKKRMRDYADEGIEHFYFMMLQKDEFIDATKSGGIGRFANHSCRPNCYVAKWTVGEYVRMGIFAKRNIKKHEELTFNYNVDRYGHQAQICYCGESNCVGFIGGKTQTDVATMDDLYLDALGITDEADLIELKGNKKKKGKKIDDPDFMPTMKPLVEKEIPKLVQAIRQMPSRKVLIKLLTRIKLTEHQAALRQIMRLRGYSIMTNILDDYRYDIELVNLSLSCMSTWPLLNRNKVDDSHVIVSVRAIAEAENPPDDKNKELAQTASSIIRYKSHFSLPIRTAGHALGDSSFNGDEDKKRDRDEFGEEVDPSDLKRARYEDEIDITRTVWRPKPQRPYHHRQPIYPPSVIVATPPIFHHRSPKFDDRFEQPPPPPSKDLEMQRKSIRAVIAAVAEQEAAKEAAAAQAAKEEEAAAKAKAEAKAAAKAARAAKKAARSKVPKKILTEEEKEALKEKRMLKLVGAVVVKSMSKHSKSMGHDQFKKHAKELTQIITDKEKKSSSYKDGRLDKLSDEKVVKIKKFAKEYIAKVLRKLEKSGKLLRDSSSNGPTASTSTLQDAPNPHDDDEVGYVVMGDANMEDMNIDSDSDRDADADEGGDEDPEQEVNVDEDEDRMKGVSYRSPLEESLPAEPGFQMDLDEGAGHHAAIQPPSDPRRRPPNDGIETWEPQEGPSGM